MTTDVLLPMPDSNADSGVSTMYEAMLKITHRVGHHHTYLSSYFEQCEDKIETLVDQVAFQHSANLPVLVDELGNGKKHEK